MQPAQALHTIGGVGFDHSSDGTWGLFWGGFRLWQKADSSISCYSVLKYNSVIDEEDFAGGIGGELIVNFKVDRPEYMSVFFGFGQVSNTKNLDGIAGSDLLAGWTGKLGASYALSDILTAVGMVEVVNDRIERYTPHFYFGVGIDDVYGILKRALQAG